MRTTHKGGGECLAMTSRRRPPRDMRGRGVSYHMGRGSLLLPSSSLCWPRSKRVVDRAQICCCLPPDLKPEMGPTQIRSEVRTGTISYWEFTLEHE
jgi:hypothetical protein